MLSLQSIAYSSRKNSCLDKMGLRLAGLPHMPHWNDALKEFMRLEFGA